MVNIIRYDRFSIEDLKYKSFEEVCDLYDGYRDIDKKEFDPGTLRYAIQTAENSVIESKKYKKAKLEEFTKLLSWLSIYHEAFFFHFTENNETSAKEYCDSCSIRISKIQNLYIIPLTNDLSLKKADLSIWVGIIAIFFSIYYSYDSTVTINKLKDRIANIEETNDSINKSLYKLNSYYLTKFDNYNSTIDSIKNQYEKK